MNPLDAGGHIRYAIHDAATADSLLADDQTSTALDYLAKAQAHLAHARALLDYALEDIRQPARAQHEK